LETTARDPRNSSRPSFHKQGSGLSDREERYWSGSKLTQSAWSLQSMEMYHFVTEWYFEAPIDMVWQVLEDADVMADAYQNLKAKLNSIK